MILCLRGVVTSQLAWLGTMIMCSRRVTSQLALLKSKLTCLVWYKLMGIGEKCQGSNPQSCSARPSVADMGAVSIGEGWLLGDNTESMTVDRNR